MAMQGAWLACQKLCEWKQRGANEPMLKQVGAQYADAWRRMFAPRLQASRVIAHLAMRPKVVRPVLPLLRMFPSLLTLGAKLSGKATRAVR